MKFSPHLFATVLTGTLATFLHAAEPAQDSDLPQPFDSNAAQALLDNSPFTRSLNLSDSLALTGIAYVDGKPMATLVNKTTKESYVVSEEPDVHGWRLAETKASTHLQQTQVKIMIGAETVTVRYGEIQLAPGTGKKTAAPAVQSAGSSAPPAPQAPAGNGPPPVKSSSFLGEGGRERYVALSSEAREKYRSIIQARVAANPNASVEETSAFAQKVFANIEAKEKKAEAPARKSKVK